MQCHYCYLILFSWCNGYFFGGRRDNHWELTIITSLVTIFSGDCIFYRLSFKVSAWITLQILSLQGNKDKVDWKLKCHCILFFLHTSSQYKSQSKPNSILLQGIVLFSSLKSHTHVCPLSTVHFVLCPFLLYAYCWCYVTWLNWKW